MSRRKVEPGDPAPCWKCGRTSTRMRVAASGGFWSVTEWCLHCDSSAVRDRAWISTRGIDIMDLPIKHPRSSYDRTAEQCSVCGEYDMLEGHHLAPRAQFGAAAERWPVVMVCRACHCEWHRRMGQPIDRESR